MCMVLNMNNTDAIYDLVSADSSGMLSCDASAIRALTDDQLIDGIAAVRLEFQTCRVNSHTIALKAAEQELVRRYVNEQAKAAALTGRLEDAELIENKTLTPSEYADALKHAPVALRKCKGCFQSELMCWATSCGEMTR